ncbi:MAG: amidohydrolase family protein [Propionibacterium sp.]
MVDPQFARRALDPPPQTPDRVIGASRLFERPDRPPVPEGAVAIVGGRVAWAGPRAALPEDYRQLPETRHPGGTILPGLIETHAHLGSATRTFVPQVPDPALHDQAWQALFSVTTARQLASVGVTTVQSLGALQYSDVALREAIRGGQLAGPRIVAAGPQLTTTGGHSWINGGEVDSVDDIRRAVRLHHKAGTDLVKVMATGGFMTAASLPWNPQFTTAELRVMVDEAHRLGKHTAAHAHGTEGIRRAVDAHIDYLAHASFVDADGRTRFDPRLADRIAEQGIFVDTCSPPSWPPVPGETLTPRALELYQHGVGLVTGHDIGAVLPPSGYTFGLRQLHASGIPRAEVLTAATTRAAAAVGLEGVTGELVAGRSADLIVTDGDPLADLDALDHLLEIVIEGRSFAPDPVTAFDPARLGSPDAPGGPGEVRARWNSRWRSRRAEG